MNWSFISNAPAAKAIASRRFLLAAGLGFSAVAILAGCDSKRIAELEEGLATEADVRAHFGEPEKIWDAGDMAKTPQPGVAADAGARTLEYNRQPEGMVNYMITIGADGKMSALRQVLTPQNFARVVPGLPIEAVRKMLGKPMKVTAYALKKETHYNWRYQAAQNTPMIFTAVFNSDLKVVSTLSVSEESLKPGGGSR